MWPNTQGRRHSWEEHMAGFSGPGLRLGCPRRAVSIRLLLPRAPRNLQPPRSRPPGRRGGDGTRAETGPYRGDGHRDTASPQTNFQVANVQRCQRASSSSKEPEPEPSTSSMNEIAACPPSPIADDPSAPPSPTSSPSSSR